MHASPRIRARVAMCSKFEYLPTRAKRARDDVPGGPLRPRGGSTPSQLNTWETFVLSAILITPDQLSVRYCASNIFPISILYIAIYWQYHIGISYLI